MTRVTVAGAGIAGLATALLLSRAGCAVHLVESDPAGPPSDPARALTGWPRPGVPQFGHSHTNHALAHRVLKRRLPDVLARILAHGGRTLEIGRLPQLPRRLHDPDLVLLLARRATIEWALRTAVDDSDVSVVSGDRVVCVRAGIRRPGPGARRYVEAAALAGGRVLPADWVVDATGRRSRFPHWLRELGVEPAGELVQPSATSYYGRHFRPRPGCRAPAGDWLLGPSGDVGYLRFSVLPEDDDGYVVTINPRRRDRALTVLRDPRAWHAAAAAIPALRDWVAPETAEPLSPVYAMGGLQNRLREPYRDSADAVAGLLCVGDALCHTDPVQGWGLSLALDHADRVSAAIAAQGDSGNRYVCSRELTRNLVESVRPYYAIAAAEDRDRDRIDRGERVDVTDPASGLFCRNLVYPVAWGAPDLFLAVQRRIHLLDPASRLLERRDLVELALRRHADRPAPVGDGAAPTRDELLARVAAA
jgi:2-polyprenyl-6-methoxyphenol hydroxylase-like FAD-dependent oxidoreductase